MAARKTAKALNILVSKKLAHIKAVQDVCEAGHNLVWMDSAGPVDPDSFDMIWSPTAWRVPEELATKTLLAVSVKAARAVKFKRAKKVEEGDEDE